MVLCPHCGFRNIEGRRTCKSCGQDLAATVVTGTEPVGADRVRTILQDEIRRQIQIGWTLTGQTDNSATLTRKGSANGLITILLLLLAILPGILYALLARPTETLFIQVDAYGTITRTTGRS